ncbi:MAG: hypothetical protein WCV84_05035 [Patescibacteria group bacterium]
MSSSLFAGFPSTSDLREALLLLANADGPGFLSDIDATVADVVGAWIPILTELLPAPKGLDWRAHHAEIGSFQAMPHLVGNAEAQAFMARMMLNEPPHFHTMPLIEGAETLSALVNKGLLSLAGYCTVRSTPTICATRGWLESRSFPSRPIIHHPDVGNEPASYAKGNLWKAQMIAALWPYAIGIIEDSTSVIMALPADYPGTVIHLGAYKPCRSDIRVIPCATWRDVAKLVSSGNHLS